MVLHDWKRLKELFGTAMELSLAGRESFINRSCGADDGLKLELRRLLAAHADAGAFLSDPAIKAFNTSSPHRLPSLPPATVLSGRFRITRFIARGGMGDVYEAEDLELSERVAIKTIRSDISADARVLDLFKHEIQLARRVTHPNVCRIFEFGRHRGADGAGEEPEIYFLAMELLEGNSLSQRLKEGGPMVPAEALPLIEQMARALEAAHEAGVIHRDFKPGNVMLVPRGQDGKLRAVVTDFGLALAATSPRGINPEGREHCGGTPGYMAPEQAEGGLITTATDVYSFGMVVAEMVGGSERDGRSSRWWSLLNAAGSNKPGILRVPASCAGWKPVLQRCLEIQPGQRYQHASEVASALRAALIRRNWTAFYRLAILAAALLAALLALQSFVSEHSQTGSLMQQAYRHLRPGPVLEFQKRNWVLICSFQNSTGERLLDGTLEYALERELSNSTFVNVVSRERVNDSLQLMRKPAGTRLDVAVGREVCLRDGGIRALLSGRVDKVGEAFELGLEILDPLSGAPVASISDRARDLKELLPALRRAADWSRERLGEALSEIRQSRQALEKVTTPSLKALQLYSLADAAMQDSQFRYFPNIKDPAAEALLRQALAEDPDFASAEIMLAYALKRQGRPKGEYLPHAKRAVDLSAQSSVRERYFILASYYEMRQEEEQARAQYEALSYTYPDHFWAANNLYFYHIAHNQRDQALPYILRCSELRPTNLPYRRMVGVELLQTGDVPRAAACAAQIRQMLTPDLASQFSYEAGWALYFPVHEDWLQGKIDRVRSEANRLAQSFHPRSGYEGYDLATYAAFAYITLGEIRKGEKIFQELDTRKDKGFEFERILFAIAREDDGAARSLLKRCLKATNLNGPFQTILLARGGLVSEAEKLLPLAEERPVVKLHWDIARGEIALKKGRYSAATAFLSKGLQVCRYAGDEDCLLGSESLAAALEHQGKVSEAIRFLEEASRNRAGFYGYEFCTWGMFWIRFQDRLAGLYRKAGRHEEARTTEDELLRYLAFADPDHPVRLRISRNRRGGSGARE
jgi:serine/threonine protein kinase/predicted Zn-dependent protease